LQNIRSPFVVADCKWAFLFKNCVGKRSFVRRWRMRRIVLAALIILLAGYASAGDKRYSVPIGDSPATGPVDAPVTIIEFIDFQ
jgi:protein-disulfide isomerase